MNKRLTVLLMLLNAYVNVHAVSFRGEGISLFEGQRKNIPETRMTIMNDTVVFDLSKVVYNDNYVQFPVSFISEEIIYSLDFALKFNMPKLEYDSILVYDTSSVSAFDYYNPNDSTLRVTAFSLESIGSSQPMVLLRFKLLPGQKIDIADLNVQQSYLNGQECISKTMTAVCEGDTALLSAPVGIGVAFSWSTGDTTQSIQVNNGGTYSVLVAEGGGVFSSHITTLQINFPQITVNASATAVCAGTAVTLSGSGAFTYTWTGGISDGMAFTPQTSAIYLVTGTDHAGCTSSASFGVAVNPLPDNSIFVNGPTVFCPGDSVIIFVTEGGHTYLWSNGATTQTITIFKEGSYSAVIISSAGCAVISLPVDITVNTAPSDVNKDGIVTNADLNQVLLGFNTICD